MLLDLVLCWQAVVLALLSGLCTGRCDQNRTLPWVGVFAATIGLVAGVAVLFGASEAPADRVRTVGLVGCAATGLAILLIATYAAIIV